MFRIKTYHYFVSYSYVNEEKHARGNGNIEVTQSAPITTTEEKRVIEKLIEGVFPEKTSVIINNFILLRVEKGKRKE